MQREQKWQFGLQMTQTLLYPLGGLILFGVLWRTLKRAPDIDIPIGVPVGETAETGNTVTANGAKRQTPGVITVDVLNQLIRENPQNMTHAIRGWMNRGQPK